ncbi:D-alanyl-D-alanine carboxypeptidase family protein [Caldicellulosiruptoraceae bacterium PP1]
MFFLKKVLAIMLILFLLINNKTYGTTKSFLNISAKSAIAIEQDTKRILYSKNANEKLAMASTTKIMTAILTIEEIDINKEIEIPKEAIGVPGSSMYLEKGEKLKIIELLYGLMLTSGNDAAVALAIAVAGSTENFVNMMNQKANDLGMLNTKFSSPHGLELGPHYTTAYDLAILTAYAMNNSVFRKIVSTKEIEVRWLTREYNRKLRNKNKMLNIYQGADGVKTGFTRKAGRCLVSSAYRNHFRVITVVLNAPDMWNDSKKILDYAFTKYSKYNLYNKMEEIGLIFIRDSEEKWYPFGILQPFSVIKLPEEILNTKILVNKVKAPLCKGAKVGTIEIIYGDKKDARDLILLKDCKKESIPNKFRRRFRIILP